MIQLYHIETLDQRESQCREAPSQQPLPACLPCLAGRVRMTTTTLLDGRVLHLPGAPFILDATSLIMAPADADLVALVPLIRPDELLLFTKRLVDGAHKRRRQDRYAAVNRARLHLARLCIDRALVEMVAP